MNFRAQFARALVAASVLLGACAQAKEVAATTSATATDCRITGQFSWLDAVPEAPVGVTMPPGFALIRGDSYTLEGDCVRSARRFFERKIYFEDRAADISQDSSLTFGEPYGFAYVQTIPSGPRIGRAPVLAVDDVSRGYSVGIWNDNGRWVVASFNDKSNPQPLLRSKAPIVAVSYFSNYHTESGLLSLIQQLGPSKARLLNYTWKHPGI